MRTKLADRLSLLILIGAFLFLIVYAYFSLYPFKILEFETTDEDGRGLYETITKEVKPGGILKYHSVFTKYLDYKGSVSCYFEDGILFRTPSFVSDNPVGLNDTIRAVTVPETLPLGTYKYVCQIFYELTMHRTIEYIFITGEFEVVE